MPIPYIIQFFFQLKKTQIFEISGKKIRKTIRIKTASVSVSTKNSIKRSHISKYRKQNVGSNQILTDNKFQIHHNRKKKSENFKMTAMIPTFPNPCVVHNHIIGLLNQIIPNILSNPDCLFHNTEPFPY